MSSLESLYTTLRKYEFPASAVEAIHHVHNKCQEFSQSGVPNTNELNNLLEFIDEFVFCTSWEGGMRGVQGQVKNNKKKGRKLNNVQQLQLLQVISDYSSNESDFSLLCSVFMIMFMIQGRDPEYKLNSLAKLVSMALGTSNLVLLNCTGLWLTQQTPTHENALNVTRHLITDYITLVPNVENTLAYLPTKSPLLTANLIVSLGELYSRVGEPVTSSYQPPPISVVRLVTSWLANHPGLCPTPAQDPSIIPMAGATPISSLLKWTVMEPLTTHEDCDSDVYSKLHYIILETLMAPLMEQGKEAPSVQQVQPKYVSHLTESLLARIAGASYQEEDVNLALDRFGQILQAVLANKAYGGGEGGNMRDLITLIHQLPPNRLLQIVVKNIQ